MKPKKNIRAALCCVLLMIITGSSDALRGVFLPVFKTHFSLSDSQSSRIIMISYVGNLIFLFVGGYLADRLPRKRFIGGVMILWMSALAAYVFTDSYAVLLCAMIFSMGASCMLSTTVNLITPLLFASPALLVNVFNFCQGVGITSSQNIGGRFAGKFSSWHTANALLLAAAAVCFVLFMTLKLPDPEPQPQSVLKSYAKVLRNPACIYLILLCGFYNVAEHGLLNWLTSYGSEYLGFTVPRSAFFLSLFFGGITLGRLDFAPLVEKIGAFRSMLIWSTAAALLYVTGIALGRFGIWLICISGLAFSIIWPTYALLVVKFYDPSLSGAAAGLIIGIAYLFDIAFNACFGSLIGSLGYGKAITVLPAAMVLFTVTLYLLRFNVAASKNIDKPEKMC
jgi:fucose permease